MTRVQEGTDLDPVDMGLLEDMDQCVEPAKCLIVVLLLAAIRDDDQRATSLEQDIEAEVLDVCAVGQHESAILLAIEAQRWKTWKRRLSSGTSARTPWACGPNIRSGC